MSVYKLIPSHYVKLHHEGPRPLPAPPCTADQFENLKLLLHTSNSKLASLATTIRELREQLRDRDATIAELTAAVATRTTTTTSTLVHNRVEVSRRVEPQDVVVDVTSDIQVRLKVELVDQGPGPEAAGAGRLHRGLASARRRGAAPVDNVVRVGRAGPHAAGPPRRRRRPPPRGPGGVPAVRQPNVAHPAAGQGARVPLRVVAVRQDPGQEGRAVAVHVHPGRGGPAQDGVAGGRHSFLHSNFKTWKHSLS
ncbi:hypothetical protein ONE63_006889 [Megalurothrips usitatus]|uniref:Uncharacterized protein n=1 Tax=Megalurothrips usitatus TaxID=439358 RepID=A0AAV7XV67_9NEOP|nr:hypothetical protein ONE63_006889 [Megalurothrips usitatus]